MAAYLCFSESFRLIKAWNYRQLMCCLLLRLRVCVPIAHWHEQSFYLLIFIGVIPDTINKLDAMELDRSFRHMYFAYLRHGCALF